MIRVLLVEHHTAVREAIAFAFERGAGFEVVAQAASRSEARGMVEGIDVAVVDLATSKDYGSDLIKDLIETNSQAQVLVLGSNLDRVEIARAVEAGDCSSSRKGAYGCTS